MKEIKELEEAINDIGTEGEYSTIQKVIAWILLEILRELRKNAPVGVGITTGSFQPFKESGTGAIKEMR